jgi:adenosylhomocysteine nucleosidase
MEMILVVGLAFEARIAAQSGRRVIRAGDGRDLALTLHKAIARGCRGLISFGIAGGLTAELRPGVCVIGSAVVDGDDLMPMDEDWSLKLLQTIPGAISGILAGASGPVATPAAKQALHVKTAAIAVDTESHVIAAVAASHGLPMVAIRVICDPLERTLPEIALSSIRADGTTDVITLLRSIIRQPNKIPELLRVALDARSAHAKLVTCVRLLRPGFSFTGSSYPHTVAVDEMGPSSATRFQDASRM